MLSGTVALLPARGSSRRPRLCPYDGRSTTRRRSLRRHRWRPTIIWDHIRNKQYRYCGAAKRRRISVVASPHAQYAHPRGLWRLPDLRNLVLTRLLHGRRGAGDGGGCGRCVAYFMRRCMRVGSSSEWRYEMIKIYQENGVVQRHGCEYWVSLGCWSRFLLGMRA